ncbi:MAG: ATP-binding protein [Gammaproteobacteria bacterium]
MSLDISQCTVAVADSDALGAASTLKALRAADFECIECPRPAELSTLLWARPDYFDAIVLGVDADPAAALEVLGVLKSDAALRGIPVVMSGSAAHGDTVSAGIRAGAHYFVTKPVDPALLVSVLRAASEERRACVDLQRELERTMKSVVLMRHAEFEFRTIDEARILAGLLANVAPEPSRVVTGLWELMLNAVEHGNLGISYAEKSALLETGTWAEEIARRLQLAPYRDRVARVRVESDADAVRFRIRDQGSGFRPDVYLDFDVQRLTHAHGRGIAMARRVSFDEVRYYARGNDVEATVRRAAAARQPQARDRGDDQPRRPVTTAAVPSAVDAGNR